MKDFFHSSSTPLTVVSVVLLMGVATILLIADFSVVTRQPQPAALTKTSNGADATSQRAAQTEALQRQSDKGNWPERPALIDELMLVGVVLSSDEASSNAVIEYRGTQRIYAVGESVILNDLLLQEVSEKQALLDYLQQRITLPLRRGLLAAQPPPSPATAQQPERRGEDGYVNHAELIKLTPRYEQETLEGLSATPNGDSRKFQELGLMSDDIITEINGISMTNKEAVNHAVTLLQGREPLQLSVRRQGQMMTLFIEPQYAFEVE